MNSIRIRAGGAGDYRQQQQVEEKEQSSPTGFSDEKRILPLKMVEKQAGVGKVQGRR
jgi:hypothetical protein